MITVRLMGGLGNQMFQYAAARRLALKHDTVVCLDLSWYDDPANLAAPFQLTKLAISEPAIVKRRGIRALRSHVTWLVGKTLQDWSWRFPGIYFEPHFSFRPEVLDLPNHTYLSGFFESVRYFADVANHIRSEFRPRDDILTKRVEAAVKIMRRPHHALVAVHVRRGDFRFAWGGKYLLPPEIILDGMSRFSDCEFLLCSDEIDWCRTFIRGSNVIYSPFSTAIEDLFAMSICDHHVIGLSTFGWWPAWLNSNPRKVVVGLTNEQILTHYAFPEDHLFW
jgi:hypothetical protein